MKCVGSSVRDLIRDANLGTKIMHFLIENPFFLLFCVISVSLSSSHPVARVSLLTLKVNNVCFLHTSNLSLLVKIT